MSPSKDLYKITRAARAEVERRLVNPEPDDPDLHAGELLAGGWRRSLRAWVNVQLDTWTPRLERLEKWLRRVLGVLTLAGGIFTLAWRAMVFYRTRGLPAAQPPRENTGTATTTIDRVPRPKPPGW